MHQKWKEREILKKRQKKKGFNILTGRLRQNNEHNKGMGCQAGGENLLLRRQ